MKADLVPNHGGHVHFVKNSKSRMIKNCSSINPLKNAMRTAHFHVNFNLNSIFSERISFKLHLYLSFFLIRS